MPESVYSNVAVRVLSFLTIPTHGANYLHPKKNTAETEPGPSVHFGKAETHIRQKTLSAALSHL